MVQKSGRKNSDCCYFVTTKLIHIIEFVLGNEEIVDILIENGAKVDHRDVNGLTALHVASLYPSNLIPIFTSDKL